MPIINMVYKKKKGWKPWGNTLVYYPLTSTSTVNDMSGNNRTLTTAHSLPTFWTYQGVDCAYFNGSNNECGVSNTDNNVILPKFTISFWLYSSSQWDRPVWSNVSYVNRTYYWFGIRAHPNWSNKFRLDWCFSTLSSWNNGWHLLLFTYDNRSEICYVDGVQNATGSFTDNEPNNSQTMKIWCWYDQASWYYAYFQWWLSNFIIENKVRTAQEVADYYNQTKANYQSSSGWWSGWSIPAEPL